MILMFGKMGLVVSEKNYFNLLAIQRSTSHTSTQTPKMKLYRKRVLKAMTIIYLIYFLQEN